MSRKIIENLAGGLIHLAPLPDVTLLQKEESSLIARVSTPEDIKLYEENFGVKSEKPMTALTFKE